MGSYYGLGVAKQLEMITIAKLIRSEVFQTIMIKILYGRLYATVGRSPCGAFSGPTAASCPCCSC